MLVNPPTSAKEETEAQRASMNGPKPQGKLGVELEPAPVSLTLCFLPRESVLAGFPRAAEAVRLPRLRKDLCCAAVRSCVVGERRPPP